MGLLGFAFTSAAADKLIHAGTSEDNVIEQGISHVSKLGNTAVRPGSSGGF